MEDGGIRDGRDREVVGVLLSLVRTRGRKRGDVVRSFSYTIVRSVTTRMRIKLEIFSSISLNSWPIGNFAFLSTNPELKFNR